MKSVLLTILVGERIESWRTSVDTCHYGDIPTALVNLVEDLDKYLQANPFLPAIWDPAGTGQDFSERWDQDGYSNFRRQIHQYASKIREAYDEPDKAASLAAWQAIFGSGFQAPTADAVAASAARDDTGEQFIDTTLRIPVRISASVRLVGRVRRAGVQRPYDLPQRGDRVGKGRYIDFRLDACTVLEPYQVYWKVKNTGAEASQRNQLRGQVTRGESTMYEHTAYVGGHYVEVYVVKEGVCVARDRQEVIIQPGMGG